MNPQPSAVRVSRLGYVGFETPDVDRLVEYYTTVLDFALVDSSPEGAFLTTGADHHCRLHWGPGRHGPGHNLFTYHRDPDGHVVELFTQIDVVHDEAKGYWEPRPWHEEHPMYPKTWQVDLATVNQWGPVDRPSLDH